MCFSLHLATTKLGGILDPFHFEGMFLPLFLINFIFITEAGINLLLFLEEKL